MSESDSFRASRTLSESHKYQIQVLRSLCAEEQQKRLNAARQYELSEIAVMSGLDDEKEVQRYLLILEGQKLVSPFPEGDFTSRRWQITTAGLKAMKRINRSVQVTN